MEQFTQILRMIAVLFAAYLLGNWFLSEIKKQRARGVSGIRIYMTLPGLLVIAAAIILPIGLWLIKK
jgi:hypothetical protein